MPNRRDISLNGGGEEVVEIFLKPSICGMENDQKSTRFS